MLFRKLSHHGGTLRYPSVDLCVLKLWLIQGLRFPRHCLGYNEGPHNGSRQMIAGLLWFFSVSLHVHLPYKYLDNASCTFICQYLSVRRFTATSLIEAFTFSVDMVIDRLPTYTLSQCLEFCLRSETHAQRLHRAVWDLYIARAFSRIQTRPVIPSHTKNTATVVGKVKAQ